MRCAASPIKNRVLDGHIHGSYVHDFVISLEDE